MAQLVFMQQTRQSGATGFRNNDPVDVLADGAELGSKANPASFPNSPYQIIDVPGVDATVFKYMLVAERGPEPDRELLAKRAYTFTVSLLEPVSDRPKYNRGDRFSTTESAITAAVILKPGMLGRGRP